MKTLENNRLVIIIWFCCGSAVLSTYALPDASTSEGGEKYAEIIPQSSDGSDPLDSFAYSLLVQHLKRPPSRVSTNGQPIEHAYYVIDTHRKPDGSPVHHPPPADSQYLGSSDYETIKTSESSVSSVVSKGQPSFNTTTANEPHASPLTQDIQPSNINSRYFDISSIRKQKNKNDETGKYNAPNPFSNKGFASSLNNPPQNSVASDSNQKTEANNATTVHTLSERLTRLSQSLKRLQMLTNPTSVAADGQQQQPQQTLSTLAASVVKNFGGGRESLPFSHFLSNLSPSSPIIYQDHHHEGQKNEPEKISQSEETLQQNLNNYQQQPHISSSTQGPVLEQGIPSNLDEEMALLEQESLHTGNNNQHQHQQQEEESQRMQTFVSESEPQIQNLPQVQAHHGPIHPQHEVHELLQQQQQQQFSQQLSHHQHQPPSTNTQEDNKENVPNSSSNDPQQNNTQHVLYHHSVSHKIPDLEMDKVINDPDIVSHSIIHSHEADPQQPYSRVIYKNKYFNVQSQNPAPQTANLPHQLIGPNNNSPPITMPSSPMLLTMDTVLQKAVDVLNNYNDIFLHNMVNNNEHYQKYLKNMVVLPNNIMHYPSMVLTSTPTPLPQGMPKIPHPLHVVDVYEKDLPREQQQQQKQPMKYRPMFQRIINKLHGSAKQPKNPTPPPPQMRYPPPVHQQFTPQQLPKKMIEPSKQNQQQKPAYARVILRHGQQQHTQEQQGETKQNLESKLPTRNEQNQQNANMKPTSNNNNNLPKRPRPFPVGFDLNLNIGVGFNNEQENLIRPNHPATPPQQTPTSNQEIRHQQHMHNEQFKQGMKSAGSGVLPHPPLMQKQESTSAESAKYSTIFLRPQIGGGGVGSNKVASQRFWHRTSKEVQNGGSASKPLNYQVFQKFGKVF